MPKMDGFEVLRHVKASFPLLPVIAMSGNMSGHGPLYLESIRMLGAERTFVKPIVGAELLDAVSALVGGPRIKRVSFQ
jgi:CheY-like chemotaxis protein